jgi:hypothetical protein
MKQASLLFLAAGALLLARPVWAQTGHEGHDHGPGEHHHDHDHADHQHPPQPEPPQVVAVTKVPATFSDEELKTIALTLSGCRSAQVQGSGEIVLAVAPVGVSGATDTLYAELSFASALNRPFRQTIWHLVREDGRILLRTYEFRTKPDHIVGMWAAPETFPPMNLGWLNLTMEMEVVKENDSYRARSLKPYPTSVGGAVTMTSDLAFNADALVATDRGYDKEGKLVWGPAEGASGYTFTAFAGCPTVTRHDGGLVVIDYPARLEGEIPRQGDRVAVEYLGYLENGRMFDASYSRGSPFIYSQGDKIIEGWEKAMADARKGMIRRVIIPAPLAHGETTGNGKVPPNSTLIYDVKVQAVGGPAVSSTLPPAPEGRPGAVTPQLQPVDPNDPVIKKMEADMRARMEAKAKARAEKEAAEKAEKEKQEKQDKPAEPAPR